MKVIQFLKYGKISLIFSALCITGGLAATIVQGGFNLGLDFQAGISQQLRINPRAAEAPIDQVRAALQEIDGIQIQVAGAPETQEYIIKVKQQRSEDSKTFQDDITRQISGALNTAFGASAVEYLQSEYVGPRFSSDLASQAGLLTSIALLLIMLYCWFRFKLGYAVAAITATIHDTLFMIGLIGAFQLEVSTATVAAILTIIGYSLNDTIVIFDRIRENAVLLRENSFPSIINTSTTQSLSRTINTSVTTLLAIFALYIFGSGDVQQFALNMIIGVVVGTYSSLFIACPVLVGWRNAAERKKRRLDTGRTGAAHPRAIETKPAENPPEKAAASGSETAASETGVSADTEARDESEERKNTFRRLSREARKRKAKK
jgi:preprotein translocase subunit SecF